MFMSVYVDGLGSTVIKTTELWRAHETKMIQDLRSPPTFPTCTSQTIGIYFPEKNGTTDGFENLNQ